MRTGIVADTHVHVYPFYDLKKVFSAAFSNLSLLASSVNDSEAVRVVCLAERHDCDFYSSAACGALDWEMLKVDVKILEEGSSVHLRRRGPGDELFLLPGRQIVTREKIEVLSLFSSLKVQDGLEIEKTIESITAAGGLPVLPWAAGKWIGKRKRLVSGTLKKTTALCVGDTSLRGIGVPQPSIFRYAREYSLPLIAGTDPLPIEREEAVIGSYGIYAVGEFDISRPSASIREMIMRSPNDIRIVGRRNGSLRAAIRLLRNEVARRKAGR